MRDKNHELTVAVEAYAKQQAKQLQDKLMGIQDALD